MITALTLAAGLGVAVVLLVTTGSDEEADESSGLLPTGCEQASEPEPDEVSLHRPRRSVAGESITASVQTSCGTFEIGLDTERSPKTSSSFVHMVEQGLYDGTWFHRIVPGFVIQGGDPAGDGTGGPGYFVDEAPPPDTEYTRGVVAMAKGGVEPPGRSGSQFFVVTVPDAGLPPDYAVLGEVTDGLDVVDRISRLGDPASGQEGAPLEPVVIDEITLD
jgi:peptidyl-prolyl cis-trans isomerase B (cyclophilin B)